MEVVVKEQSDNELNCKTDWAVNCGESEKGDKLLEMAECSHILTPISRIQESSSNSSPQCYDAIYVIPGSQCLALESKFTVLCKTPKALSTLDICLWICPDELCSPPGCCDQNDMYSGKHQLSAER